MADNDAHIAEVVAGENKVYVDTGIFPTAERRHMADRVPIRQQPAQNKYSKCPFALSFKSKKVLLTDQ